MFHKGSYSQRDHQWKRTLEIVFGQRLDMFEKTTKILWFYKSYISSCRAQQPFTNNNILNKKQNVLFKKFTLLMS